MILNIIIFVLGLLFLLKGADYFVKGGGGLALRYRVAPALIGFTVIAFGTSLPEFVVSIRAISEGNPGIALGNVLGSNIANIALVLALCAALYPAIFLVKGNAKTDMWHQTMAMFAASAIFVVLAYGGVLTAFSGIVFLLAFVVIMYLLWIRRADTELTEEIQVHGNADWMYTIGGLLGVIIGSELLLNSANTLAVAFGIPSYIIGVSMVAVGTSLPELATSLVALYKGETGISAGNILGSNIFNLLFVMGGGSLLSPIPIPSFTDVLIMAGFALAVLPFLLGKRLVIRGWGIILLLLYGIYIAALFIA